MKPIFPIRNKIIGLFHSCGFKPAANITSAVNRTQNLPLMKRQDEPLRTQEA